MPPLVRLLVCNPLTKECRVLPSVTASVINDAGSGPHLRHNLEWHISLSSRRRLYFADVDAAVRVRIAGTEPILHAAPTGDLRLFEVEAINDAGILHTYPPRKYHLPFLTRDPDWDYDYTVSPFVELVECMDDLYAVIPARLDEVLTTGPTQSRRWRIQVMAWKSHADFREAELESMPLVFYIVQLQPELQGAGAGGMDHGVLRIRFGRRGVMLSLAGRVLYKKADPGYTFWHKGWSRNWFQCTARESISWVAFDDYLLQYDVVSGESKTQIIHVNETEDETLRFSYTPSFHMKP